MGEILGATWDQVDLVQTVSPASSHEGRYRALRAFVSGFIGRLGASRRDKDGRLWVRGGSLNSKTLQSAVENVKVFIAPLMVSNVKGV